MSQQARVLDVAVFEQLDAALARFAEEARGVLRAVRLEARRVQEQLEQEIRRWQAELHRREELRARAAASLVACLASGHTDREGRYHAPDCSDLVEAERQARRACEEAIHRLDALRRGLKAVQQRYAAYEQQAHRLEEYLASELPRARQHLHRSRDHLSGYTAAGAGGTPVLSGPDRLVDAALGAPVGLTEALSGLITPHPSPEPSPPDPAPPLSEAQTPATAPASFSHLPPPRAGRWEMVDLSRVNVGDMQHVGGEQDFKKVPYAEMEWGIKALYSDILPAIRQGHSRGYFESLDRALGLPPAQGFLRVFDAFFGSKPIHLEEAGGTYTVVNGYHRIWLAKKLGFPALPALVVEVD